MLKKVLIVISLFFVLSSNAYAAKRVTLSNPDAADRLGNCILSSDAEFRESENYIACCSRSSGECIVCPSDGSGSCVSVAYSSSDPRLKDMRPVAPMSAGDFMTPAPVSTSPRDRLKRTAAPAYPAKNMSPPKKTIVKPIKQYQQIKAPTKTIQTIEK